MIATQISLLICASALIGQCECKFTVGEGSTPPGPPSDKGPENPPPAPPKTGPRPKRSTSCTPTSLTESEAASIVQTHNQFRSDAVNIEGASAMMELEWDDDLAGPAQDWANQCIWAHGYTYGCDGGDAGQNMALRTGGQNINADQNAWNNEKDDYNYEYNSCSSVCGHYTQVVWDNTRKVGCGINVCSSIEVNGNTWNNAVLFVCNYSPSGNYQGQKPFDKGDACSDCQSMWPSALDPFTCTSDNLCGPGTTISDATCKYPCVNGTRSSTDCACECDAGVCGQACDQEYLCVNGNTTGEYGCGCVCNDNACGTSCDEEWATENEQSDNDCNWWKSQGYCYQHFVPYMNKYCAKACEVSVCQ